MPLLQSVCEKRFSMVTSAGCTFRWDYIHSDRGNCNVFRSAPTRKTCCLNYRFTQKLERSDLQRDHGHHRCCLETHYPTVAGHGYKGYHEQCARPGIESCVSFNEGSGVGPGGV